MLVIDLGKLRQGVQDFFDGCKDSLISTEKSLEKSVIRNFLSGRKRYTTSAGIATGDTMISDESKSTKNLIKNSEEGIDEAIRGQCSNEIKEYIERENEKYNFMIK